MGTHAKLPARLTLPSGTVVQLRLGIEEGAPIARAPGAPLFSEV